MNKIVKNILSATLVSCLILSSSVVSFAYDYSVKFTGDTNNGAFDGTTRWGCPLKDGSTINWGTITSKWSEVRTVGTSPHIGVDVSVANGDDVVAVQAGYVTVFSGNIYNTFSLSNGGSTSKPFCHYEHMSTIPTNGAYFSKGNYLGQAGDVGSESSGIHLHFGAYDRNAWSGRLSYRNETFYRDSGTPWENGKRVDVWSQSQWNSGKIAKITAVFSGAGNTHNEAPAEVRIFHRKNGTTNWTDGGIMTKSGHDYTYQFSTSTYPVGTKVDWMVRIKRSGISYPYVWAPAKYNQPDPNPNATTNKYAFFSNTIS